MRGVIVFAMFLLTLGGLAAFFIQKGVYDTRPVGRDTIVVVNRITGKAFQIRRGLKEPVADSSMENRLSKLFEKLYEEGGNPFAANPAPSVVEPSPTGSRNAEPRPSIPADDPYIGMYSNPFYKSLSEPDQFEYIKAWTDNWIRPFEDRSLLISKEGRETTYRILIKALLSHPHVRTLSDKEKDEMKEYYRLRVHGQ